MRTRRLPATGGWHLDCFVRRVPAVRPCPLVVMLNSFDIGGTERQTVELVRRLDPDRFRVHLACILERGPLLAEVPPSIPMEAFPVRGFRSPGGLVQLARFARYCRRVGARVVHTCDLYANILGLHGAALAGVPARIGSRREVLTGDKSRLQLNGQRSAYRLAHAIVANSTAAAEQVAREGVAPDRVRLVPNGVDTSRYLPRPAGPTLRRVTMVANLRREKGHDVIIDAAPRILAAHPEAEFTLAGDGPRAAELADRARARGVGDRIRFIGECRDVPALLAQSDLFVLPSRSEAFPNALLEAMAAGLPVVASEVGGIPELVTQGVTGLLVPAGDPRSLAGAVSHLMDHPDRAAELGQAARANVAREYGMERMVERMQRLYATLLERHAGAGVPSVVGAR